MIDATESYSKASAVVMPQPGQVTAAAATYDYKSTHDNGKTVKNVQQSQTSLSTASNCKCVAPCFQLKRQQYNASTLVSWISID